MLNDATWRKMPIDILTNENMSYIESMMPEQYKYAPYMFYQAALRKADDDGIFDLEDGVIFARLMRVPSEKMVFYIANLMGKRKLIFRVSEKSNKCLLADWDYPKGADKRSWAERRAIVQKQIQEELANAPVYEEFASEEAPEVPFFDVECDKIEENVSQTVECDKNQKNVSQTVECDKIEENVSQKKDIEREREREIERENIETHTQERKIESVRGREREAEASAGLTKSPATASADKKALAQTNKKTKVIQKESLSVPVAEVSAETLAADATKIAKGEEEKTGDFAEVSALLDAFFVNNAFGYEIKKGRKLVDQIANEILSINSGCNPSVVAQAMCTEFKKMHDSEGQWKDIPLTPKYMSNHAVWEHLLTYAGKKLAKNKKTNAFLKKAEEERKAVEAEKDSVIAEMDAEYIKYGIDPNDPSKVAKLLFAKRQNEAQESVYEGDIF